MDAECCPHCKCPFREMNSSFLYDNGFYSPDQESKVTCPNCSDPFWIKPYQSIAYEVAETEGEL